MRFLPLLTYYLQVLLLIGYFTVLSPAHQLMLTWGRSPTVIQALATLPFDCFSDRVLSQV